MVENPITKRNTQKVTARKDIGIEKSVQLPKLRVIVTFFYLHPV